MNETQEKPDYDRLDSGMAEREHGTPYTIGEAKEYVKRAIYLDPHAVGLLGFLLRRVERLEAELNRPVDRSRMYPS
jgi:hypothetical protein